MLAKDVLKFLNEIEILICRMPIQTNVYPAEAFLKKIEEFRKRIVEQYANLNVTISTWSVLQDTLDQKKVFIFFNELLNGLKRYLPEEASSLVPTSLKSLENYLGTFKKIEDKLNELSGNTKEYQKFKEQITRYRTQIIGPGILQDSISSTAFQLKYFINEFDKLSNEAYRWIIAGEQAYVKYQSRCKTEYKYPLEAEFPLAKLQELDNAQQKLAELNEKRAANLVSIQEEYDRIISKSSEKNEHLAHQKDESNDQEIVKAYNRDAVKEFSDALDSLFQDWIALKSAPYAKEKEFQDNLTTFINKLHSDLLNIGKEPGFNVDELEKLKELLRKSPEPTDYLQQLQNLKTSLIQNYLTKTTGVAPSTLKNKTASLDLISSDIVAFREGIAAAKRKYIETLSARLIEKPNVNRQLLSTGSADPAQDDEITRIWTAYKAQKKQLIEKNKETIFTLEEKLRYWGYEGLEKLRKTQETELEELLKNDSLDLNELKKFFLVKITELQEKLIDHQYQSMTNSLNSDAKKLEEIIKLFPAESQARVVISAEQRRDLLQDSLKAVEELYLLFKKECLKKISSLETELEKLGVLYSLQASFLTNLEKQGTQIAKAQQAPNVSNEILIELLKVEYEKQRTELITALQDAINNLNASMGIFDIIKIDFAIQTLMPSVNTIKESLHNFIKAYNEKIGFLITQPQIQLGNLQTVKEDYLKDIEKEISSIKSALVFAYGEAINTVRNNLIAQIELTSVIKQHENLESLEREIIGTNEAGQTIKNELTDPFAKLSNLRTAEDILAWQKDIYSKVLEACNCASKLSIAYNLYITAQKERRQKQPIYMASTQFLNDIKKEYERIVTKYSGIDKELAKAKKSGENFNTLEATKKAICNIENFNENNPALPSDSRLKKLHEIYQSVKIVNDAYLASQHDSVAADSEHKNSLGQVFADLRKDDMQDISADKRSGFTSWLRALLKKISGKTQESTNVTKHSLFKTSFGHCRTEKVLVDSSNEVVNALNAASNS
ncbi:Uncharacterised protein [Legionella busanensis]|uniref:Uncharacterized protein n=1 Tax=Legionella busanensis TaxID=190655 RepID=A0A378JLI6_9GAMM|nr:hypothetical protein [Legionella busanensis]STX51937.1 Uncharacterised protein [Legionella busanensis]